MMFNAPQGYVEIHYDLILMDKEEKGAIWFQIGDRKIWIPRSQIDEMFDDKSMLVSEWFAIEKCLV